MAKIVIAIAVVVLLLCVGGLVLTAGSVGAVGLLASRVVQSDPAQVAGTAAKIADFTLPAGYKPDAAVEIAGTSTSRMPRVMDTATSCSSRLPREQSPIRRRSNSMLSRRGPSADTIDARGRRSWARLE